MKKIINIDFYIFEFKTEQYMLLVVYMYIYICIYI